MGISTGNIVMAAGFGALYVQQQKSFDKEIERLENLIRKTQDDVMQEVGEIVDGAKITPEDIGLSCRPVNFVLLMSNVVGKYCAFKVGVLWENTSSESIKVEVTACAAAVGGIEQDCNQLQMCGAISVMPYSRCVQILGGGRSKVLWSKRNERRQAYDAITGGGLLWGAKEYKFTPTFNATYTGCGSLSDVRSDSMNVTGVKGLGLYWSNTPYYQFDKQIRRMLGD